jgi:hypothetical protein
VCGKGARTEDVGKADVYCMIARVQRGEFTISQEPLTSIYTRRAPDQKAGR